MDQTTLFRAIRMLMLLCIQVLIINHIHLAGYITPLIIGYMTISFRQNSSRVALLLWSFFTGLIFDVFNNSAGMAAASLTLLAMMQPSLLKTFVQRDKDENVEPTLYNLGFWRYLTYTIVSMLILHSVFYALDAFSLYNWKLTLAAIGGSTIMSSLICIIIELLVRNKKR